MKETIFINNYKIL